MKIGSSGPAANVAPEKENPDSAVALLSGILILNAAAWLFFLWGSLHSGVFLSEGILAYVLGIRHGFDADHIAVIDNVVRKLQSRGIPAGFAGFSFAIGHSIVVVASNLALILFFRPFANLLHGFETWGSWAGNFLSAGFLTYIGMVNILLVIDIFRTYRKARPSAGTAMGIMTNDPLAVISLRSFATVPESRTGMVSLGLLFGLSFDTSAEIALLVASLLTVPVGMHNVLILLWIPLLFAAGIITVDTLDGIVMSRAYRWAMEDCRRTYRYNLVLTGLSVCVAWGVGSLEWFQLIGPDSPIHTVSWNRIGEGIVLVFLVVWGLMVAGNRLRNRWTALS